FYWPAIVGGFYYGSWRLLFKLTDEADQRWKQGIGSLKLYAEPVAFGMGIVIVYCILLASPVVSHMLYGDREEQGRPRVALLLSGITSIAYGTGIIALAASILWQVRERRLLAQQ